MKIYPTIQIEDKNKPGDYVVIEERNFDPKTMKVFEEKAVLAAAEGSPAASTDEDGGEVGDAPKRRGRPRKAV